MRQVPVIDQRMLAAVRPVSEGAMTDQCTVGRPQGQPTVSGDGLTVTPAPALTRYAGRCRVVPFADAARVREVAERPVTFRIYRVFLPWDATPVEVDDIVTITRSADPDLDGRALRVMDVPATSLEAERVLLCEEAVD
jgi:hypothetical protein